MQLTIIGAGAIGGTIGAHMIRAGHDILFCDADLQHVEAINRDGLTIEGPVENFTVRARAVSPEGLPDRIVHAAVAVKSHHTAQAAQLLHGRIVPGGWVVSFQNGLTADILGEAVGRDKLIVSFVNFGADVLAPGRIMQGNIGTFRVGEPDMHEVTPRVRELVDALPYAAATENVMGYLWSKEAYGSMLYAGAVSDLSIADSLEDPRWRPLMLGIAREVLGQAPVVPESFDGFEPNDLEGSLPRLVAFNRNSAKSHSGIYRDLMVRRRKTEVDDMLRDLTGPLTTYVGEVIHAIERGERTCEIQNLDLLATYERAVRLGRPLNALVRTFHAPRRAAEGALHGIAVAVKDNIDVEGAPRGNGNPRTMAGAPASADAPVVASLRACAADVFATSSLLEYAAGATHPDVPEVRNPFDLSRTAGGSSGGSAALVGVGVCDVALGTDTGGSIRIPAHYCAVVGFKPTYGALSLEGVEALSPSLDHVGLLARDVAITRKAFAALTGAQPVTAPSRFRIGIVSSQLESDVLAAEVASLLAAAVDSLRGSCDIVEVDGSAFDDIAESFDDILLYEAWEAHRDRVEADPDRYGPETLRLLRTASMVTKDAYESAMARRARLLPVTGATYDGVDVILTPVAPFVAPATTPPIDTEEGAAEALFTCSYNVTGAPAIALPCGWSARGLPVGLQLSAPRNRDMELLAVAERIEELLAVERRPSALD